MTDLFDLANTATSARAMGSHQSAKPVTTTWMTPPEVIHALGGAESFDLDPCTIADRPWPTARRHISLPEDGLTTAWEGRVWLNPPYTTGEIGRWLRKLADHDVGTALIFARTETDAFHAQVWGRAAGLLFLHGRLHFHFPDGRRAPANSGAPSVLCAYGADDLERLADSGLDGALVPLRFARFIAVAALETSWRDVVVEYVRRQSGPVELASLYRAFARHPKARSNRHWAAKLRQTLQRGPFQRVGRGSYALAS